MSNQEGLIMKPTHVFASLSPRVLTADEKLPDSQKRKVEVSGSAELTIPPDTSTLSIILVSNKEKASEARASVERRVEYVKQTLLNNGIPEGDIVITENLKRTGEKNYYCMETQIDATFCSALQQCMKLSSLFVEKLETCVRVLPPVLSHDQQRLESQRKQACLLAFANARQKAVDLCKMLNQGLGRPIFVTENVIRERRGCGFGDGDLTDDGGDTGRDDVVVGGKKSDVNVPRLDLSPVVSTSTDQIDVQRRMRNGTIHIRVDVTATFELRSRGNV